MAQNKHGDKAAKRCPRPLLARARLSCRPCTTDVCDYRNVFITGTYGEWGKPKNEVPRLQPEPLAWLLGPEFPVQKEPVSTWPAVRVPEDPVGGVAEILGPELGTGERTVPTGSLMSMPLPGGEQEQRPLLSHCYSWAALLRPRSPCAPPQLPVWHMGSRGPRGEGTDGMGFPRGN